MLREPAPRHAYVLVDPGQWLEDPLLLVRGDAEAAVAHLDPPTLADLVPAHLDVGGLAGAHELGRVGHEVLQDPLQRRGGVGLVDKRDGDASDAKSRERGSRIDAKVGESGDAARADHEDVSNPPCQPQQCDALAQV